METQAQGSAQRSMKAPASLVQFGQEENFVTIGPSQLVSPPRGNDAGFSVPHPCQCLSFFTFVIFANLAGIRSYHSLEREKRFLLPSKVEQLKCGSKPVKRQINSSKRSIHMYTEANKRSGWISKWLQVKESVSNFVRKEMEGEMVFIGRTNGCLQERQMAFQNK